MSSHNTVVSWAAVAVMIGCNTRREAEAPTIERAGASATPAPIVVESRGALATRREAQDLFDRAQTALVRRDYATEANSLLSASDFFRTEARNASEEARSALERAAQHLERLADRAGKREPHPVRLLACAFAEAHGAEALHHLFRAKEAIAARDNVRAGEELAMSVDHLERAVRDVGLRADTTTQTAIADARSLAVEMMRGMAVVPDEEFRVTEEIGRAVRCVVSHE